MSRLPSKSSSKAAGGAILQESGTGARGRGPPESHFPEVGGARSYRELKTEAGVGASVTALKEPQRNEDPDETALIQTRTAFWVGGTCGRPSLKPEKCLKKTTTFNN